MGRVGVGVGVCRCSWYWKCTCEIGCCKRGEGGGGGGRVCVNWHHLSDLLLSCLIAGCHCPSPGPPAPGKPRSHLCCSRTFIKLCSTNAIKSPQLRVNRWKVWHFAFDWRWIGSDGPDRRIQAWIWIYFFSVMLPHSPNNPSSEPSSSLPRCLILPISEVMGPSCKGVCPTTHPILNHHLTV